MEYLLEALHVTKVFGTLKANDDVTLKVKPGEMVLVAGAMVARSGPYRFRVWVKLPGRPAEIEFAVSAGAPHGGER